MQTDTLRNTDWDTVRRSIISRAKGLCRARPHPRLAEKVSLKIAEQTVPEKSLIKDKTPEDYLESIVRSALAELDIVICDDKITIEITHPTTTSGFDLDWYWSLAVPDALVDDLISGKSNARVQLQGLRNRRS